MCKCKAALLINTSEFEKKEPTEDGGGAMVPTPPLRVHATVEEGI